MTPENIQRALNAGDQTIAADMRANPERYVEYNQWLDWKPVYNLDPEGVKNKIVEKELAPYFIGGAALIVAWFMTR